MGKQRDKQRARKQPEAKGEKRRKPLKYGHFSDFAYIE